MKTVVIAAALLEVLAVGLLLLFAQTNHTPHVTYGQAMAVSDQYAAGVNAALDAMMLLNLEQQLQGTNRTWGAMAEIVCERLRVERRK
jgi:predicted RNA polymerase sigma factor